MTTETDLSQLTNFFGASVVISSVSLEGDVYPQSMETQLPDVINCFTTCRNNKVLIQVRLCVSVLGLKLL